ncbi:MAG: dTDP-4-dehydrorhamnose reductase, partial [Ignavibacteriales bacterium CG_4_9_14_3_um_filter_34_10]
GLINLKATTELGYLPHKIEETFALMQEELSLI